MKLLSILFILLLQVSISDIRAVYQSQDEDKVLASLKSLESKATLSADEKCYKAVFTCMKADYLTWPNDKLAAFKKGYKELNTLISVYSTNVEYRYHRFMIEKHTPSWLIDVDHQAADKAFVKKNLKASDPMYDFITKTIDK